MHENSVDDESTVTLYLSPQADFVGPPGTDPISVFCAPTTHPRRGSIPDPHVFRKIVSCSVITLPTRSTASHVVVTCGISNTLPTRHVPGDCGASRSLL